MQLVLWIILHVLIYLNHHCWKSSCISAVYPLSREASKTCLYYHDHATSIIRIMWHVLYILHDSVDKFNIYRESRFKKGRNTFHVLWKESLISDGGQFHQYQQNGQSPIIWTELTEHKKTYDVGNPDPGLGLCQ
jgi:hypothetical protein